MGVLIQINFSTLPSCNNNHSLNMVILSTINFTSWPEAFMEIGNGIFHAD